MRREVVDCDKCGKLAVSSITVYFDSRYNGTDRDYHYKIVDLCGHCAIAALQDCFEEHDAAVNDTLLVRLGLDKYAREA